MNYSLALRHIVVCSIAVVAVSLLSDTALAQTPSVTYDLDFTTDFEFLMDRDNEAAQRSAMRKTPAQMSALRSSPMMRLTNHSTSELSIETFRLDLGTSDYLFDAFTFLEQPANGNAILTSHSDMLYGNDTQNFVEIQLPNGLLPGESVAFQVQILDVVPTGSLADYTSVLWDDDNSPLFSPDRTDNALVSVTYRANASSFTPTPARLFEYPFANIPFDDTSATGTSGRVDAYYGGHNLQSISFNRYTQTAIVAITVPEPTTGCLALAAIIGYCGLTRRRRSR